MGIDPGLATVGIGVVECTNMYDIHPIDWLTIQTPANTPLPGRLREIQKDLADLLKQHTPDLAVVEQLFFAKNKRTAIAVAHARGAILLTLAMESIPLIEPTPMELKNGITGDGSADKQQIQDMLVQTFNLSQRPKPDDAADALALALYGALQEKGTRTFPSLTS